MVIPSIPMPLVHSCWKSSIAMILLAIAATESLLRGTHVFSRASAHLVGLPKVYDCNQRAHNAFDVQMSREQLHRRRASWHIRSAPAPFGATRSIVSELVPLAAVPHNCQLPLPHQHPDRRAVECRCSLRIAARKQARKRTDARPVLPDASSSAAVVPTQKRGASAQTQRLRARCARMRTSPTTRLASCCRT